MDKDKIKALIQQNQDKFISGIHNYCDRWCERCRMTEYCSVFALEQEMGNLDRDDPDYNEKFWEGIRDLIKVSGELLNEKAEEMGIDLDELTAGTEQEQNLQDLQNQNDPLITEIRGFIDESDKWLDHHLPELEQHRETVVSLDEYDSSLDADQRRIGDLVDVIHWYTPMIYAKTERALFGKQDILQLQEEDPVQNDYNGSAKIAILGIDRLIGAWTGLLIHFRSYEDDLLSLIIRLDRIKKEVLSNFPDAPKFKRPGFDD